MSSWGVLAGLFLGIGIWMIAVSFATSRQRLLNRVLIGVNRAPVPHQRLKWLDPMLEKLGSTAESVLDRLEVLEATPSLEKFRLQQFLAGLVGTGLMTALAVSMAVARPVSVLQWILMILIGFVVGTLAYDRVLTWRVAKVSRKISAQVADAAELLALSISAGESIPTALRRVRHVVGPELGSQLGNVLSEIENGSSVSRALLKLRDLTKSRQLARLLDTLVSAMERGAPLSTTLREQARDLRDEARSQLMESGGKQEIAMLFPVVFVILPVTVVFALYPGLVALRI
ncbi:MAG: type II secretion system F family protein [Gleimia sp.]|jgi:tight adherence protein C|nr:type II secretion system F family protein [Acidobacteriota bacterium]